MEKIKLRELSKTCGACPAQWEGRTKGGAFVYVRFRWGGLSMGIGATIEQAIRERDQIWSSDDEYGGSMDTATMLKLTGLEFDGDLEMIDDILDFSF